MLLRGALTLSILFIFSLSAVSSARAEQPASKKLPLPENLARTAKATASSEHSDKYLARFAVDG